MHSWNVIFLIDQIPLSKILLLKRSASRNFAPNLYTGVGGKVEPNETLAESAYRELNEETGLTGINLHQFAKVIIDEKDELVYYWGIYKGSIPASNEGTLEWVSTNEVLSKNIIPTTLEMLKHWESQNFSTKPFELHVKTISEKNKIKQIQILRTL